MKEIQCELQDNRIWIRVSGRIDSGNAGAVEEEMRPVITDETKTLPVLIDAEDLEYLSSAGRQHDTD